MRNRPTWRWLAVLAIATLAAACSNGGTSTAGPKGSGTGAQSKFFVQADYDKQMAQRTKTPQGDASKPWLQMIDPVMADTSKFKKAGPWNICFSNASVSNPWRVVGYKTMLQEVKLHPEIGSFAYADAQGKDDKQISDMNDLLANKKCDALIVSPNTTDALTPAVTKACATGVPVIDFDRGVTTDCPTTFVHPIGGYAYGAEAAEFISSKVKSGGNVIALRILPGVDVLETRWSAAKVIFDKNKINVVDVQFTQGDGAKVKSIVTDDIQRFGHIDGVWMDAGATSVAAIEAFEDAGKPVPPVTGEDQNDYLLKWQKTKLAGDAPTYPTFQWRTALIAATMILNGQQVPKEWILPQPEITSANLDKFADAKMPPLFYPMCGCQTMPNFPSAWQGS